MIQEFHFWILAEENENTNSKRYMHHCVHCSIIDNSQYNGNNLSEWIKRWVQWNITQLLQKEWNLAIVNMDGSWGHNAKWNQSPRDKHFIISYVESKQINMNI